MARNFYNLRFLALFVAFAINFILLFYKVSRQHVDHVSLLLSLPVNRPGVSPSLR